MAIFHASFHPTQGNVVDWSLKASDGELKIQTLCQDTLTAFSARSKPGSSRIQRFAQWLTSCRTGRRVRRFSFSGPFCFSLTFDCIKVLYKGQSTWRMYISTTKNYGRRPPRFQAHIPWYPLGQVSQTSSLAACC